MLFSRILINFLVEFIRGNVYNRKEGIRVINQKEEINGK